MTTFTKFDLEQKSGQTCHDKVEIFDGYSFDQPKLLGTYCGNQIPTVPASSQNSIEVDFTSDARHQATGFTLKWTSKEGVCGGRKIEAAGSVQSPGFPTRYSQLNFNNFKIRIIFKNSVTQ